MPAAGRLALLVAISLVVSACSVSITTVAPERAESICGSPEGGGYLTTNPQTGLGILVGQENHPVIWPVGFSARRNVIGPLMLVDRAGNEVAQEGDLVGMAGGYDQDGVFHVCDETKFRVTKPS
jgi:hypothetical protein